MSKLSDYFKPAQRRTLPKRLAICADGIEKVGRTYYALMTTPDPICLISTDTGTEAVLQKALEAGRRIHRIDIDFTRPDPRIISKSDVDKAQQKLWQQQWDLVNEACYALRDDTTIRTLVADTWTDVWHLAECAVFGKLRGNIDQKLRTELNSEFRSLFWSLYKGREDLNMVLIHRLKKSYENNEWSGKYEREGFNAMGPMTDLSLRFYWDHKRKDYYTMIDPESPTRYGGKIVGQRWYAHEKEHNEGEYLSHFAHLGCLLFPETEDDSKRYWGFDV